VLGLIRRRAHHIVPGGRNRRDHFLTPAPREVIGEKTAITNNQSECHGFCHMNSSRVYQRFRRPGEKKYR
jgi:hypothetical protein